jgi:hypothetical protein
MLDEFGYSKKMDLKAAAMLDSILDRRFSLVKLKKLIFGKSVFVIGAGPSLQSAIPVLKKYKNIIKICADTALAPLLQSGITPQIVVTDLDGDLTSLRRIAKKCIVIVHAHGDNMDRLEFAKNFKNCIGTTQTKEIGKICNFGGFTDGDRCVFLAEYFGAAKMFLFGMDFGPKIGRYSKTKKRDRKTKLKKLRFAKMFLEWMAPKTHSKLFTLSKPIRGFKKITYKQIEHNVSI